jgi:polyisoprenoid-binding protein YceI
LEASFAVKLRLALLLFMLGFAGSGSAHGSNVMLTLNRANCEISFSLRAVLHTVHGTFEVSEGMLRLDVASGKITGRIVVNVKSGNTGEPERDQRMHQDVLESAQFPEAIFLPDRLIGQLALSGKSDVNIHGSLRIYGQDHEVTLPAKVSVENGRLSAISHLSIPYVKWGMKDPSTLVLRVDKIVEVRIAVAGTIRQE